MTTGLLCFVGLAIGGFFYEWITGRRRWIEQAGICYWQGSAIAVLLALQYLDARP